MLCLQPFSRWALLYLAVVVMEGLASAAEVAEDLLTEL
jgi:hypothetical protein